MLAILALALSGCGGDGDSDDNGSAGGEDGTALTVTLLSEGPAGPERAAELDCPEAAASDACEEVEALPPGAADPVPAGTVCTQIYGGPDVVRLEGTLRGEAVSTELTRENGCEIERFERFGGLLDALFDGYEPGAAMP